MSALPAWAQPSSWSSPSLLLLPLLHYLYRPKTIQWCLGRSNWPFTRPSSLRIGSCPGAALVVLYIPRSSNSAVGCLHPFPLRLVETCPVGIFTFDSASKAKLDRRRSLSPCEVPHRAERDSSSHSHNTGNSGICLVSIATRYPVSVSPPLGYLTNDSVAEYRTILCLSLCNRSLSCGSIQGLASPPACTTSLYSP